MEREGSSEREEEPKWRRWESAGVGANGSLVGDVKKREEMERAAISLSLSLRGERMEERKVFEYMGE